MDIGETCFQATTTGKSFRICECWSQCRSAATTARPRDALSIGLTFQLGTLQSSSLSGHSGEDIVWTPPTPQMTAKFVFGLLMKARFDCLTSHRTPSRFGGMPVNSDEILTDG